MKSKVSLMECIQFYVVEVFFVIFDVFFSNLDENIKSKCI